MKHPSMCTIRRETPYIYSLEMVRVALQVRRRKLEKEVRAGDYIFVPYGIEHGIKNTSKKPLVLIATHSPPLF
ncbi:cupin domain protein [archaeon]|nr:cupin domain protein [archaeon]